MHNLYLINIRVVYALAFSSSLVSTLFTTEPKSKPSTHTFATLSFLSSQEFKQHQPKQTNLTRIQNNMKTPLFPLSLTLLVTLSQLTHAWYECTLSTSVPLSTLLIPSGSTSGSTDGLSSNPSYLPATSPGCSFYIAAGGTCTTTKIKRNEHRELETLKKRITTYTILPCLDSMNCVTVSSQLGCVDLKTFSYIDDTGTCYDTTKDEKDPNCVEDFLKEQSVSGSVTATVGTAKATGTGTGTASGLSSTATSLSVKGGVASIGAVHAAAGSVGLLGLAAGFLLVY